MGRGHRQVSPRRREAETMLPESEPGSRELRNLKPDPQAITPCRSGSGGGTGGEATGGRSWERPLGHCHADAADSAWTRHLKAGSDAQ